MLVAGLECLVNSLKVYLLEREKAKCINTLSSEEIARRLAPLTRAKEEDVDPKLLIDLAKDPFDPIFLSAYSELWLLQKIRQTYPSSKRNAQGPDISVINDCGHLIAYIEVTAPTDGTNGPHFDPPENTAASRIMEQSGDDSRMLLRISGGFRDKEAQYTRWMNNSANFDQTALRLIAFNLAGLHWAKLEFAEFDSQEKLRRAPLLLQALTGTGSPRVQFGTSGSKQIGYASQESITKGNNTAISTRLLLDSTTIHGCIGFNAYLAGGLIDTSSAHVLFAAKKGLPVDPSLLGIFNTAWV